VSPTTHLGGEAQLFAFDVDSQRKRSDSSYVASLHSKCSLTGPAGGDRPCKSCADRELICSGAKDSREARQYASVDTEQKNINLLRKIIDENGYDYFVKISKRAIQGANLSLPLSHGCLPCNLCPSGFGINIVIGGSPLANEQYFDATPSDFNAQSGQQDPSHNNFQDSPTSFGVGSGVEMLGNEAARFGQRMRFTKSLTPVAVDYARLSSSSEMIHSGPPSMFFSAQSLMNLGNSYDEQLEGDMNILSGDA
jgi:hypothetical protein